MDSIVTGPGPPKGNNDPLGNNDPTLSPDSSPFSLNDELLNLFSLGMLIASQSIAFQS
jgi:hypothetical protein